MASFDEILTKLHDNATLSDSDGIITITPTRQFQVPADYNLIIAYAGDVNSQIITFKLPLTHEAHNLFNCEHKRIKWKNMTSGTEGFSTLENAAVETDGWICQWEVPPEAMTQSGNLEVAIVLYNLAESGRLAFAWNTSKFKGFLIGETFADVGIMLGINEVLPAADEILSIVVENRTIVAPKGYNTTVANYGDKGISKVYFQVDKYVRGINVLESKIIINVKLNSDLTKKTYLDDAVKPVTEEGNKVLICWDISKVITNNADYYSGKFTISVTFIANEGTDQERKWTSSSYNGLSIGESLLLTDENHIAERDEGVFKKVIYEEIDNYLDENEFAIGETND